MDRLGPLGDPYVAQNRAALLRHAEHVEHADALALEMCGHAEQRADGDDPGAADTCDEDSVWLVERRRGGFGKFRQAVFVAIAGAALLEAAALDRDKAGAEPLEAGEILIAARLVDCSLAAELGLDRSYRQAVRRGRTVAAAFADEVVDDHAARRVGEAPALAPPALFGGAGLVVDDGGDAGEFTQIALHRVEVVAV